MIERVVPGMRERGFGRIVSVSSSAAREPIPTLLLSNSHRPGPARRVQDARAQAGRRRHHAQHDPARPHRHGADRHLHGSIEEAEKAGARRDPGGPARHGRGDRRRRGVPVLGARELHHRRRAAGGRRADAGASDGDVAEPPAPTPCTGVTFEVERFEWTSADAARAGRPLVRAARPPLPEADARRRGGRRAAAHARGPRAQAVGRGGGRRSGSPPSPGRGDPAHARRRGAHREPRARRAAAGAGRAGEGLRQGHRPGGRAPTRPAPAHRGAGGGARRRACGGRAAG